MHIVMIPLIVIALLVWGYLYYRSNMALDEETETMRGMRLAMEATRVVREPHDLEERAIEEGYAIRQPDGKFVWTSTPPVPESMRLRPDGEEVPISAEDERWLDFVTISQMRQSWDEAVERYEKESNPD